MGQTAIKLRGTLTADGRIELEGRPSLPPGPVQVTLEAVTDKHGKGGGDIMAVIESIWAERRALAMRSPTAVEVDAAINSMRDEDEARLRALERIQHDAARARSEHAC